MDKSNKSQRQTCDQDMSSTFYPVASEKSMDEILGPTTQKPGKWKNKKGVTFAKSVCIVVQFLEGYTMFMYQMLHILDLQCTSYVHDSTLRVSTKVVTIPRSSVLPSIRPSWIQSKVLCEVLGRQQIWLKHAQSMRNLLLESDFCIFLLEVGVKQSANIDSRNRAKVRIKCDRTTSIRTASARHWHSLVIKYMGHRTNAFTASNKRLKFPWF